MKTKEKCNSCSNGLSKNQKWIVFVSIYVFIATIIGSIEILRFLISFIF
jgi:hypothetical protein